jgi:hypothetical protein
LKFLPGKTVVVLATDGGPNCNADASCDASECMANIEGLCSPETNCCAPGGLSGPEDCVDSDETVAAIESLADAGIKVYVIGMPGSQLYGNVLDRMAIAGGAAKFSSPYYERVDDLANISAVLSSIATLVVSCDFFVPDEPPAPNKTNVYLDGTVLPRDPENGWTWKDATTVELHGKACARLKTGEVAEVQIVSGCPTVEPL